MNGSKQRVWVRLLALLAIWVQAVAAPGLSTRALADELLTGDMMAICVTEGHGSSDPRAPDQHTMHHGDGCCLASQTQHAEPAIVPERVILAAPTATAYRPVVLPTAGGPRAPPFLTPPARAPPTLL